jgi:Acyl-CoA carboxylase epsilon subunit
MSPTARPGGIQLRSISPDATPEEVAAITAAIAVSMASARAGDAAVTESAEGSAWVQAARITARRGGYARGSWRLSGRLGRRARA